MSTIRCFVLVFAIACNSFTAAYDDCNEPLLDKAHLTATSALPGRGPYNARLNGGNAWTASSSDFGQYLVIDLGQVMNITAVATQGRAVQNEYVMEYGISYGTNGLDYVHFKEEDGNFKEVLRGHQSLAVMTNTLLWNWGTDMRYAALAPAVVLILTSMRQSTLSNTLTMGKPGPVMRARMA